MLVIIGSVIVMVSVMGGFMIAGGHPAVLLQWSEFIIILGSAFGSMITMAPMKVHKDLIAQIVGCLKGSPYNKAAYEDMFKALYELFMLGRRNGMVSLSLTLENLRPAAFSLSIPHSRTTTMRSLC